jgi:hypothetical protein
MSEPGRLAAGRLHGLAFLTGAVAQLRGDCGQRQVPGAQVAVMASAHLSLEFTWSRL